MKISFFPLLLVKIRNTIVFPSNTNPNLSHTNPFSLTNLIVLWYWLLRYCFPASSRLPLFLSPMVPFASTSFSFATSIESSTSVVFSCAGKVSRWYCSLVHSLARFISASADFVLADRTLSLSLSPRYSSHSIHSSSFIVTNSDLSII